MDWTMVQWTGLWSKGLDYGPKDWTMVQWTVLWSDGLGYGPMDWTMVQWTGLWSNGLGYGPMDYGVIDIVAVANRPVLCCSVMTTGPQVWTHSVKELQKLGEVVPP